MPALPPAARGPHASRSYLGRVLFIALLVIGVDQATKLLARRALAVGASRPLCRDAVRLTRVENTGIAFGMLRGRARLATLASGLASAALFALTLRLPVRPGGLGPGLVLGGWAGNALDRARRGSVTDFLDLGCGPLRWPSFNLADAAIFGGALVLLRALAAER